MKRFDISVVGELNADLILYGLPQRWNPNASILPMILRLLSAVRRPFSRTTFRSWAAALVSLPASVAILSANSVWTASKRAAWMFPG